MRFKKIYIEITNICNMNCSFCKKESRPLKFMSVDDFNVIFNKIKDYTESIYLHVKGEPLMHPELEKILNICYENKIKVNITTNGTLLNNKLNDIINSKIIRQINISLHCNLNDDTYLKNIIFAVDQILNNTNIFVNYRLWNINKETDIVNKINEYYHCDITKNNKIKNNLFIEMEHVFEWPTINNDYYNDFGKCYGLINQIAILVDGTVTPCCLDSEAIINLGNVYHNSLNEIIESKRAKNIINGFKCNKKIEELCKHCNFYYKRK